MSIFNVISLLGGLALFLYGMRIMGDGLKKNTGAAMQKALSKVTNNAFKGFVLGLLVTALIQSSTATIVLTAGLVGAGLLTLRQSVGIVFGANVGTTVTGQIIRLMDLNASGAANWLNVFKPDTLAPIAALLGIIMIMFIKSKNSATIGEIAMGFGILFTGLISMSAAVAPLSESEAFINVFARFSGTPLLGFLCGTAVSTIVQSSSASVGMLQTLSTTGVLTFSSIYPILIGIYVGDAITTAMVCSIGTSADAKRTGMITVMLSVFSIVFLMLGVTILHKAGLLARLWNISVNSGSIANTNTLFKLSSALVCVPMSGLFYKLSLKIVKDRQAPENIILDAATQKLDDKLFLSPKLALNSAHQVVTVMQRLAIDNTRRGMEVMADYQQDRVKRLTADEECIDHMADAVDEYLIRLSSHIDTEVNSDLLNYYMQCNSEVERIGDYAMNLSENAEALKKQTDGLSDTAKRELNVLFGALSEILEYANDCFRDFDMEAAAKIEPLEEVIDDLVAEIKKRHIRRLRDGQCSTYTGLIFVDALTNIERISDQCSNIAVYTLALHNTAIMHNRHDYIQSLHDGRDAFYNQEYKRQREAHMNALA